MEMKITESNCVLLVDSKNKEIDEDKNFDRGDDAQDSDSPNNTNDEQNCVYGSNAEDDPSWTRSYRKSRDLLGIVPTPSLSFLGSPPLSCSFLSSSPKRRPNSKINTSLGNPLLPPLTENHCSQHRSSDHWFHSQWTSSARKLSNKKP